MIIELIDRFETEESREICKVLERVASFGIENELKKDAEVTLTLCDGEEIREINREHRGIDSETDVLSFPLWDVRAGEEPFVDPESKCIMLGDIIISMPRLKEQAEEYGHSVRREAAYLCIHGILHLLGYDHMTDEDKCEMRAREEELLSQINFTRED